MKLYSWNVNGIRAVINKGEFATFVAAHNPDIICLQETKAQRGQVELDLPQYHEHFYSAAKKGYAGTAIFSRTPALQYRDGFPEDIATEFQVASDRYGDPNDEGRIIAAEFDEFWLVTCYTPNAKGDLSRLSLRHRQWDPACLAYLKGLEAGIYGAAKPVLYCGDMNVAHQEIDLARPKDNVGKHGFTDEERAGFQAYLDAGFVDVFRATRPETTDAYTWWTHWGNARARNVGWRIDYWLASQAIADCITEAAIHPEQMGSDHCPVSITI
ncbi:MAG: exodeoxyribonuclease III [Candidatus Saccharibacteria bacterium]|nr:exodeoxyribonuclease III [Candidatus Saccharibacteria bacterium]